MLNNGDLGSPKSCDQLRIVECACALHTGSNIRRNLRGVPRTPCSRERSCFCTLTYRGQWPSVSCAYCEQVSTDIGAFYTSVYKGCHTAIRRPISANYPFFIDFSFEITKQTMKLLTALFVSLCFGAVFSDGLKCESFYQRFHPFHHFSSSKIPKSNQTELAFVFVLSLLLHLFCKLY